MIPCSCAVSTMSLGGGPSAFTSSDGECCNATSSCGRAVASVQPSRWCPRSTSSGSGGTSCSARIFSTQSRCSCVIMSSSVLLEVRGVDAFGQLHLRRHDEVDAVGLAVDVLVDPGQLDLELVGGEVQRAEHAHAAGPGDRGDDVAAVTEREDRELEAHFPGESCAHARIVRSPPSKAATRSRFGLRFDSWRGRRASISDGTGTAGRSGTRAAETAARKAATPDRGGRARGRRWVRRGADARRRGAGRGRARHALPALRLEGPTAARRARGRRQRRCANASTNDRPAATRPPTASPTCCGAPRARSNVSRGSRTRW